MISRSPIFRVSGRSSPWERTSSSMQMRPRTRTRPRGTGTGRSFRMWKKRWGYTEARGSLDGFRPGHGGFRDVAPVPNPDHGARHVHVDAEVTIRRKGDHGRAEALEVRRLVDGDAEARSASRNPEAHTPQPVPSARTGQPLELLDRVAEH